MTYLTKKKLKKNYYPTSQAAFDEKPRRTFSSLSLPFPFSSSGRATRRTMRLSPVPRSTGPHPPCPVTRLAGTCLAPSSTCSAGAFLLLLTKGRKTAYFQFETMLKYLLMQVKLQACYMTTF